MLLKNTSKSASGTAHARLSRILEQPNAPFREGHPLVAIEEILRKEKIPFFRDPAKNLVVGAKSKAEYLKILNTKSTEPVRIFIAHLDHPGFHGVKWEIENELMSFRWHGGSPTAHLEGAKVWLANAEGFVGEGRVEKAELIPSGRAIAGGTIRIKDLRRSVKPTEIFGGFGFRETHWAEGDLLYTKCADDLIGAFAIVEMAIRLKLARKKADRKSVV